MDGQELKDAAAIVAQAIDDGFEKLDSTLRELAEAGAFTAPAGGGLIAPGTFTLGGGDLSAPEDPAEAERILREGRAKAAAARDERRASKASIRFDDDAREAVPETWQERELREQEERDEALAAIDQQDEDGKEIEQQVRAEEAAEAAADEDPVEAMRRVREQEEHDG